MPVQSHLSRRIPALVLVAVAALVLGTLRLVAAPAASADTAPPVAGTPLTASSDVLPTVQVNGVVWAQLIVGNTVYVTGEFTSARPAGSPAGTNETPRSNILAYNLDTGDLITSWAPSLDAQGLALAASADGSQIFVGGGFTTVSGVARYRLAALDAATGAVVTSFAPAFNASVQALAIRGDNLYAAGSFTVAESQSRSRLAAVSASTGALLPWAPTPDAEVLALVAPAGTSNVVLGGRFATINALANYGLASVDDTSGAVLPWAANQVVRNGGSAAAIYSLTSANGKVYGSGYTFGAGGNLENTFAADAVTGALLWVSGCRGDTYSTAIVGDVLYSVSHSHDCSAIGSFPQTTPTWTYQRASAQAYDGVRTNNGGSFAGRPAPTMLHWAPSLNVGTYTGQSQAAWTVTANSQYVLLGGEFPTVNGVPQQGLARFAVKEVAPNKDGPQGGTSMAPTLTGIGPGTVRFTWIAPYDRDNVRLKYEVLRGAKLSTAVVVATTYRDSAWWDRQAMGFTDTGATPGSTESYRIRMTDPFGNVAYSATVAGTVPAGTAPTSAYNARVGADGAAAHWRLGEASGTAYDWSGRADLTPAAGTARSVAGAISGDADTAVTFPGTATVPAVTAGTAAKGPQTFSLEAWFKTTSIKGGKIIGFGNKNNAASTTYDRMIYLTNGGQLVLGVFPGQVRTVTSPLAYNNGQWHHVVGTLGSDGLALYVDGAWVASRADTTGAQDYTGWWRVGGDAISTSWPSKPTSTSLAGSLDEVAVYPAALTTATVQAHWQLGRGIVPNQPPTASFTAAATDRTISVDGSGSTDADGTITSYAWTFGDGATGTGATATHTYAAAGTYPITLTVTDNSSATGSTTQTVTVTDPPVNGVVGADAFGRTVATGLGTADTGGAWTVSASGVTVSVADGSGRLSIPAGRTATATLPAVSALDTDLLSTAWVETQPTGGGVYLSSVVRRSAAGDYRARLKVQPNGQAVLNLSRTAGSTETALTPQVVVPGVTYTAGMKLAVRVQAVGSGTTTLQARVWVAGTAEPTTWLQSVTDTTADLQVAGGVGLVDLVSGSATATPVIRHDDLTATRL